MYIYIYSLSDIIVVFVVPWNLRSVDDDDRDIFPLSNPPETGNCSGKAPF